MLARVLTDGHSHISDSGVLRVLEEFAIYTLACATEPSECEPLRRLAATSRFVIPTYGLHPWKTNRCPLTGMLKYLNECSVIGEIGLDSRWGRSPLNIQRNAFLSQLEIAQRRNIPVILHTTGQEKPIADIIMKYSMPVLVHWYECDSHLDLYIKRDCYFTVGEAILSSAEVRQVAKCVPIDRLLVETDGIDAIRWLRKRKDVPVDAIPGSLRGTLAEIAAIRKLNVIELTATVNQNFFRFINRTPDF